ncbi:MAG: TIGR03560 family F420-dependent LLM class oxidoreductase [Actinomycetota bacterium]
MDEGHDEVRVPAGALVVLVGPSGGGKSTWAERWFPTDQIVSTDRLRSLVGTGEHDQRAGSDAFDVADLVLERRLRRGLTTVVDSLGLDADRRAGWIAAARARRRPVHAVAFDLPDAEYRRRNRSRADTVPSKVLTSQLRRWPEAREALASEFDAVHAPGPARVVAPALLDATAPRLRQKEHPMTVRFGLQLPAFDWPGGTEELPTQLGRVAAEAEAAGFSSLWLMDHLVQIPFVGREWEPMLESWTTLGFLAAATERIRLGTMVTGITYRNVAHLGKIVATLDVLSGGRAECGIGAAWFEREHLAYGWRFPPLAERYELLEDALELLPVLWGPGAPSYSGRRIEVAEAICYPRPVQERVPILVGGSGEQRTLRLVARHADACNLFGEPDVVRRKVEVLHEHCRTEDRDPEEIRVTQLSTVLCAPDADALSARVDELRTGAGTRDEAIARWNAGTTDEHIGRFRRLAESGVQEAIVSLPDVGLPGSVERFAPVIEAFRAG